MSERKRDGPLHWRRETSDVLDELNMTCWETMVEPGGSHPFDLRSNCPCEWRIEDSMRSVGEKRDRRQGETIEAGERRKIIMDQETEGRTLPRSRSHDPVAS